MSDTLPDQSTIPFARDIPEVLAIVVDYFSGDLGGMGQSSPCALVAQLIKILKASFQ